MKLWEESLSPEMTSEDSIRSCSWNSLFETLPSPRSGKVGEAASEKNGPLDFEIRKKLGAGGMGVVYTAHQTSINREVALKMVRPEFASSRSAAEALMSEAVVTGCLDHPNVVPIYDLGVDDEGRLFYAMKEVEGHTWSSVIADQSLDENLDILLRVADTIAFAHSKGILHRDLKPQNIMLGSFGEVMVMDWGAACSLSGANVVGLVPSDTAYCGTPAYMAPEMAKADKNRLGETSDVYLLGAILYQIITGHPPRQEKDPMLCLVAAAENRIDCMQNDSELLRIALKAMSNAPMDRYQRVEDFQKAIRKYRSHSESLSLLDNAKEYLKQAEVTGDYNWFNRAIYGFREALALWDENYEAEKFLDQSIVKFAINAMSRHDLEFSKSILDTGNLKHEDLSSEIRALIKSRNARRKRAGWLFIVTWIVLIISVLVGLLLMH